MDASHPFDPYTLFAWSASRSPSRIALQIGERSWTYAELNELSRSVASWCAKNTDPNARVAIHGHKGVWAYAGILGVLRAGRSYVPLHPDHPLARWKTIVERAGCAACIGDSDLFPELGSQLGLSVPKLDELPADTVQESGHEAYVMFTSGSTGGPKGVPVSRTNVAAYLEHMLTSYDFGPDDRFTQLFALTFDLSVHDLFVCWGAGACLCVPEDGGHGMASFIEQQAITCWFSVPSYGELMRRMRQLVPDRLDTLRHTFFCGEVLHWDLVDAWKAASPGSRITNLYGPTEATIAFTAFECADAPLGMNGVVPIGKAFGVSKALVLAREGEVEGELCVSGPQVVSGYLGRPEATAKAFRDLDGKAGIWYHTGDRVRTDEFGDLHFLGRLDDQVKVLGHRVEPGEVDEALAKWMRSGRSVTLGVTTEGTTRLVTFIDIETDHAALMDHLRTALPEHMVPSGIVRVGHFPLTVHGKVDRQALIGLLDHG